MDASNTDESLVGIDGSLVGMFGSLVSMFGSLVGMDESLVSMDKSIALMESLIFIMNKLIVSMDGSSGKITSWGRQQGDRNDGIAPFTHAERHQSRTILEKNRVYPPTLAFVLMMLDSGMLPFPVLARWQ